jgi:hypothetical protein
MVVTSATLDRVINKIGSPYSIYAGSMTWDNYGGGSITFTGSVAVGYVQVLTDMDDSVRAGILNIGDAIGYFKMDSSFPAGSKIEVKHQEIMWETIGEPIVPHLSGNQLMRQIYLRKKVN